MKNQPTKITNYVLSVKHLVIGGKHELMRVEKSRKSKHAKLLAVMLGRLYGFTTINYKLISKDNVGEFVIAEIEVENIVLILNISEWKG